VAEDEMTTQTSLGVTAVAKVTERVLPSIKEEGNAEPTIVRTVPPLGFTPVFGVTEVAVMATSIGVPLVTGIYPPASLTRGYHDVPATAAIVQVI
jgi:hypothetical protein